MFALVTMELTVQQRLVHTSRTTSIADCPQLLFTRMILTRHCVTAMFRYSWKKSDKKVNVSTWARCMQRRRSQDDRWWCHFVCVVRMTARRREQTLLSCVICSVWSKRRQAEARGAVLEETVHAHLCCRVNYRCADFWRNYYYCSY